MPAEKPLIVLLNSEDTFSKTDPAVKAEFDFQNVTELDAALSLIDEKKRAIAGVIASATLRDEPQADLSKHFERLFQKTAGDVLGKMAIRIGDDGFTRYKSRQFLEFLLVHREWVLQEKGLNYPLSVMANSSTSAGNSAIKSIAAQDEGIQFFQVPDYTGVQSDPTRFISEEDVTVMTSDSIPGGGKAKRNDLETLKAFFASLRPKE